MIFEPDGMPRGAKADSPALTAMVWPGDPDRHERHREHEHHPELCDDAAGDCPGA